MTTLKPIKDPERMPYRLRETFMSTTELALLRTLQEMVGTRYIICPKVGLNDIFYIVRPNENVHFFNKIFRKHVDFLLCDPKTLKPVMGIELVKPVTKKRNARGRSIYGGLVPGSRITARARSFESTLCAAGCGGTLPARGHESERDRFAARVYQS